MLEIIRNDLGNILACCEWRRVNAQGKNDKNGKYIWIHELEISKPQVIYKPSMPNPTQVPERKKVSVTVTEVGVAGTYYCYEDKANTIAQKQTDLNNLHKLFDFCGSDLQYKIKSCFDACGQNTTTCINNCLTSSDQTTCNNNCISQGNACTDKCPKGTECNDKSNDVMKAQDELRGMIRSYCP